MKRTLTTLISLFAVCGMSCGSTPVAPRAASGRSAAAQITPPGLRVVLVDGTSITGDGRTVALTSGTIGASFFGSGADGSVTFDGSSVVLGITPSSNTYILTRNIWPSTMTVNTGVTIKTTGWMIVCSGTLTLSGTALIHGNGVDAVANTGAAQNWSTSLTYLGGGGAGGGGATGNGSNGGVNTGVGVPRRFQQPLLAGVGTGNNGTNGGVAQGGTGGSSGAGLTSGGVTAQTFVSPVLSDPDDLMLAMFGRNNSGGQGYGGASGGGGGSGDNVNGRQGGGGGSGGGWVIVRAKKITGSGSITSKGGNGGNGVGTVPVTGTGGGGGGGGGVVVVISGNGLPTIDVSGGAGGSPAGTGRVGGNGGTGLIYSLTFS